MQSLSKPFLLATLLLLIGCVDQIDYNRKGDIDIIVVEGTLTNRLEEQVIRLNRSKADPFTGRFGSLPLTKIKVEVVVDSSLIIPLEETLAGSYKLPASFKGQVGHSYQLRFQLADGTKYESTQQIMPNVSPIEKVRATFNPTSFANDPSITYKPAHELYIDTQDPANEINYYRWDWDLFERQEWCSSCVQGVYAVNKILPGQYKFKLYYVSGDEIFENCFTPPPDFSQDAPSIDKSYYVYDYQCRTKCWEIFHNTNMNLFDDRSTNGGRILGRKVAQIPFYQRSACLVHIRQMSLTKEAYDFYTLFQNQVEKSGGVADTPPTALIGNVYNVANKREPVVGFFTASAVSFFPYWIDRKDTKDIVPPGLFQAMNDREPEKEPDPPYSGDRGSPKIYIWGGPLRVPTAVCVHSDSRTPFKPEGWKDE